MNGTQSIVPELNTMHSTEGISRSIPTLVLKIENWEVKNSRESSYTQLVVIQRDDPRDINNTNEFNLPIYKIN